jgi:hypothetical protein
MINNLSDDDINTILRNKWYIYRHLEVRSPSSVENTNSYLVMSPSQRSASPFRDNPMERPGMYIERVNKLLSLCRPVSRLSDYSRITQQRKQLCTKKGLIQTHISLCLPPSRETRYVQRNVNSGSYLIMSPLQLSVSLFRDYPAERQGAVCIKKGFNNYRLV